MLFCLNYFVKSIDIQPGVWYYIVTANEVITVYSYHNRIKQRINNGELVDHYFTDNYPGIGKALVLVFKTAPFLRPIRPHKYIEYVDILADCKNKGGK